MNFTYGTFGKIVFLVAVAAIGTYLYFVFNPSTEKLINDIRTKGFTVRKLEGIEAKEKMRHLTTHGASLLLTAAKSLATPEIDTGTVGFILDINGVTIEVTRFRTPYVAGLVAKLQSSVQRKEFMTSQCSKAENTKLALCSRNIHIAARNFLFVVSDIQKLVENKDEKGTLKSVGYLAVPVEKLDHVVQVLRSL